MLEDKNPWRLVEEKVKKLEIWIGRGTRRQKEKEKKIENTEEHVRERDLLFFSFEIRSVQY